MPPASLFMSLWILILLAIGWNTYLPCYILQGRVTDNPLVSNESTTLCFSGIVQRSRIYGGSPRIRSPVTIEKCIHYAIACFKNKLLHRNFQGLLKILSYFCQALSLRDVCHRLFKHVFLLREALLDPCRHVPLSHGLGPFPSLHKASETKCKQVLVHE